jgi:hypothetical protein
VRRCCLEQAVSEDAITVPQQAVQRDPAGASVLLVGDDGKVKAQPVKTGAAQGSAWIISEGLKPGDRVIVEGFQKVKPGATVRTLDESIISLIEQEMNGAEGLQYIESQSQANGQAQLLRLTNAIDLYRALGGGLVETTVK